MLHPMPQGNWTGSHWLKAHYTGHPWDNTLRVMYPLKKSKKQKGKKEKKKYKRNERKFEKEKEMGKIAMDGYSYLPL